MNELKGFSLTEVLVSLFLISTLSIGFLKQSFLLQKMLKDAFLQQQMVRILNTNSELFIAESSFYYPQHPFLFEYKSTKNSVLLSLCLDREINNNCLKRMIIKS